MNRFHYVLLLSLTLAGCGQSAASLYDEGKAALDAGDRKTAIAKMGAAVKRAPDDPKYHHGLAVALARSGALEQARSELEAAIALDPSNVEIRRLLDRVHRDIASRNADLVR